MQLTQHSTSYNFGKTVRTSVVLCGWCTMSWRCWNVWFRDVLYTPLIYVLHCVLMSLRVKASKSTMQKPGFKTLRTIPFRDRHTVMVSSSVWSPSNSPFLAEWLINSTFQRQSYVILEFSLRTHMKCSCLKTTKVEISHHCIHIRKSYHIVEYITSVLEQLALVTHGSFIVCLKKASQSIGLEQWRHN